MQIEITTRYLHESVHDGWRLFCYVTGMFASRVYMKLSTLTTLSLFLVVLGSGFCWFRSKSKISASYCLILRQWSRFLTKQLLFVYKILFVAILHLLQTGMIRLLMGISQWSNQLIMKILLGIHWMTYKRKNPLMCKVLFCLYVCFLVWLVFLAQFYWVHHCLIAQPALLVPRFIGRCCNLPY